jgi:hypothetical protein
MVPELRYHLIVFRRLDGVYLKGNPEFTREIRALSTIRETSYRAREGRPRE